MTTNAEMRETILGSISLLPTYRIHLWIDAGRPYGKDEDLFDLCLRQLVDEGKVAVQTVGGWPMYSAKVKHETE